MRASLLPTSLVPLALAAATGACASLDVPELAQDAITVPGHAYNAAQRIVGPPQLAPIATPAPLAGDETATMPIPAAYAETAQAPNSLWRAGARSFFRDQRAARVGDILTVDIEISDKAELTNTSNRTRTSSTSGGVTNFLGLESLAGRAFPDGFDPQNLINAQGDSSATGQGSINREEKIELKVAAVVVDVLANGNFVIAGRQQVRINAEMRELTVSGVIRPEDVDETNSIRHDQIAEARISYGGRGQISAVQRPRWGQRVADAVAPW
ncbi:MAG: flagellar basal body L-ring protein FlgH [Hyphomonadaceae bacterium]|nr:flagellar basal body L-ring protein FlgH [Hyphomonadaceae bacterium]